MFSHSLLGEGGSLVYYAFDILHLNGADLKDRPLRERRALLQKTLGNSGVRLSESLPGTLPQIIQAVKAHGLEGVIAKRLDSKYQPDRRSEDWLKLPLKPSHNFVIGAYRLDGKRLELLLVGQVEPAGAGSVRHVFSPMFVKKLRTDPTDAPNHPKLQFAGKVHQGLNPANRRALLTLLQPLATKKCPFANLPTCPPRPSDGRGARGEGSLRTPHSPFRTGEGVTADEMADYTWLRPEIEAEIKFTEWTQGGVLRHAEFLSLRQA